MARSKSGANTRKKNRKNRKNKRTSRSNEERVWLGGRGRLPVSVEENGVAREVDWLLWMELRSGMIVGSSVVPWDEPDGCLGRLLLESIALPMIAGSREPNRIRVASKRLAAEVRNELGARVAVEVRATPELDAMAAELAAALEQSGVERRYLDDDVDASLIESFFESAAAFACVEPWRIAGEAEVLRLDIPELDLEGAAVLIAGAEVGAPGFIVFDDIRRCMDFVFGEEEADDDVLLGGDGESCLAMSLLPRSELSAAMHHEIDEHGWPMTPAGSCPVIARPASENVEILPTRRDYRIATAVTSALAYFVSEHAAAFDEIMPGLIRDTITDASGVRVELSYPVEMLEDEWVGEPDWEDTPREVRLSAKVYQAVRELDLLSPRARAFLASATPSSDGDSWMLGGEPDDLQHLTELLSAAADRRIGGSAIAEAAAVLRMGPTIEFDGGDAAANASALRSLLRATESLGRSAERRQRRANARTQCKRGPSRSIYQLKVTLRDVRPPIWRRLEVRSDITLARLHDAIQDAMGWTDSHLHQFECDGELYGVPSEDDWTDIQNERRVRLDELLQRPKDHLDYEYDFGDSWRHRIVLEKVLPATAAVKAPAPRCTAGKRACPPEDCGGTPGYRRLLHVLAHPHDPECAEMLEWMGEPFDPDAFEVPDR